jgi:hypothetical protein
MHGWRRRRLHIGSARYNVEQLPRFPIESVTAPGNMPIRSNQHIATLVKRFGGGIRNHFGHEGYGATSGRVCKGRDSVVVLVCKAQKDKSGAE